MSEWTARILHISDLHERGPREVEPFRRRRVLGDAWKRNLDALLEDGRIDLVCFTGDIADWGKPEEYGRATDFIEALLRQISLPIDRLFLVPGNHDIDRKKGENVWAELRGGRDSEGRERKGKLSRVPRLELSRWMAGGTPPLGLEGVSREELLSRQSAYGSGSVRGSGARNWHRMRRHFIRSSVTARRCGFRASRSNSTSWAWTPHGSRGMTTIKASCSSLRIRWGG